MGHGEGIIKALIHSVKTGTENRQRRQSINDDTFHTNI